MTESEGISHRLGARIRQYRELKGWSQQQLADAMQAEGFPWIQSTLTRIENGQRNLTAGEAIVAAMVLGFDLRDLETERAYTQHLRDEAAQEKARLEQSLQELDRRLSQLRREHMREQMDARGFIRPGRKS